MGKFFYKSFLSFLSKVGKSNFSHKTRITQFFHHFWGKFNQGKKVNGISLVCIPSLYRVVNYIEI